MLRTRIISSILGLMLLIGTVSLGNIALGIFVMILSVIGIYEFFNAVKHAGYKAVNALGYISCIPVCIVSLYGEYRKITGYIDLFRSVNIISLCIFLIIMVLFLLTIIFHDRYNIIDISLTIFGIFYVPFLLSFIILTRNLENGIYYIWLIFIGAFATDTFAYFSGRFAGKTKLLPAISPKKTAEGAIGGVLGCVLIMLIYGIFINGFMKEMPLYHFAVLGILSGVISQIGDWAASSIKRFVNIKDYGKIMPGHGGVLDRFDSILFTAPLVYFYITFIVIK